jgi:hypothetical protein
VTDENGNHGSSGYVLFVWSPSGWRLQEREGETPAVGATVEDGETRLLVSKVGPSPLPGDRRRCAFTQLA